MKAIVVKKSSFDAAHFLPNYPGKCANMHGHHWVVELGVEGNIDPETHMVIDFSELNKFLKEKIVARLDHRTVNDIIANPTAEFIAHWIKLAWDIWSEQNCLAVDLVFVRVWETEDSYAEVRQ